MNLLLKSVLSLGLIVVNLFAFSFSDIASQIESKTKGLVKVTLSDSNFNLAGEKINNYNAPKNQDNIPKDLISTSPVTLCHTL